MICALHRHDRLVLLSDRRSLTRRRVRPGRCDIEPHLVVEEQTAVENRHVQPANKVLTLALNELHKVLQLLLVGDGLDLALKALVKSQTLYNLIDLLLVQPLVLP